MWSPILLSNAERAEDQIQNVVAGGGSRNLIERLQGAVEIQQEHLMGNFVFDCYSRRRKGRDGFPDAFLMA